MDLDGTLIRTDLLLEPFFALLKQNALYAFVLPVWLLEGKANLKHRIAEHVELDASRLPYNKSFLDYLREEKERGRELVLATASNVKYADQIARHLGLFDAVLASDASANLSGPHKKQRLLDSYGERGFDYAGNSKADLDVWSHAAGGVLVNPEPGVQHAAENLIEIHKIFDDRNRGARELVTAMRPHQWLKNLLVFVPLVMAHRFHEPQLMLQALLAFVAFSLCASSAYLLNDLLDLPDDRQHPTKRNRPIAAGKLPIVHVTVLIPVLLLGAFATALPLALEFLGVLALYYAVTLAYSLVFRRVVLVDVVVLAGLYTARIIAGAAATTVFPSFWLLAFSMFFFFSLALVKRYSELLMLEQENRAGATGRSYLAGDLEGLAQSGIASGYLAVVVLALYINSAKVMVLYGFPAAIWMLCPLLLYWVSRIWLLARRGKMRTDPVVFAIEDAQSRWLGVIGLFILWVAI